MFLDFIESICVHSFITILMSFVISRNICYFSFSYDPLVMMIFLVMIPLF